jgi:hypothetical protein
MGESWLLGGPRAFYRGFLTGLLVVPLCFELGCIFWECGVGKPKRSASISRPSPVGRWDRPAQRDERRPPDRLLIHAASVVQLADGVTAVNRVRTLTNVPYSAVGLGLYCIDVFGQPCLPYADGRALRSSRVLVRCVAVRI